MRKPKFSTAAATSLPTWAFPTPRSYWRRPNFDPTLVFMDGAPRESYLKNCDMRDADARRTYENTGNMLFVMETFFRRVDMLCGGLAEPHIRDAEPHQEDYTLEDDGGLYLLVKTDGSKHWRLAYHFGEELKDHHFGNYPDQSLSDARRYVHAAYNLLKRGKDPAADENLQDIDAVLTVCFEDEPNVPMPTWVIRGTYYSLLLTGGCVCDPSWQLTARAIIRMTR